MSGNPLDKYRDTRTSAASSAQGCGWVEIQHNLCFVDDEGQTEPAAGVRYQLQVPSGPLIQGVLDENGFASHEGIGFGTVSLEIEPYIDNDKKIILQSIKKTMDEFIAEERKESEAIKARLKGQSAAGVTWEYAKAGGEASGNLIMDSVEFFGNLVWDVGKEAVHLTQYLNPWAAPMAFERDAARFKQAKKELQAIADTDLSIFTMLMNDADTQQLFMQFADDYLDAQHSLEITEGSAATATAVILSIATAFAGSAIAAGNGAAKLTQLGQKLSDPIKRLIEVLERARAKKRVKHEGNQRIESEVEIRDNIAEDVAISKNTKSDFIGSTGRLGGAIYSTTKLTQLESYLGKRGIQLKVGDEYVPLGKAGGFNSDQGILFLRSNPTNYEVWHEISHFRQYQKLGKEEYLKLPRSKEFNAPEQYVFDMLENSPKRWNALNFDEQQHAIRYIENVGGFR